MDGKPRNEIKVSLFGQPCTLAGHYPETTLKLIHSISPEQVPWSFKPEVVQTQIQKFKTSGIPAEMESYARKAEKRLTAWKTYLEAERNKAKTSAETAELLKVLLPSQRAQQEFSKKMLEITAASPTVATWTPLMREKVRELFLSWIESDPQEDFHRGLSRMNARYICAFEESEQNDEEQ